MWTEASREHNCWKQNEVPVWNHIWGQSLANLAPLFCFQCWITIGPNVRPIIVTICGANRWLQNWADEMPMLWHDHGPIRLGSTLVQQDAALGCSWPYQIGVCWDVVVDPQGYRSISNQFPIPAICQRYEDRPMLTQTSSVSRAIVFTFKRSTYK